MLKIFLFAFFSSTIFAQTCDIPEPYSSLCSYTEYKYEHVPNDTFGFAPDRLDVYLDGNTRFPAQDLLGFALAGNTDAMQKLAGAFENKDWREYWYKKIFETRGMSKPIPPLQLEKMPIVEQEAYKNKQAKAINEMLNKADNKYIKDKLNCLLVQYDKNISMEELAKGGSECAIKAMADRDIVSADNLKQQGKSYTINYNLEKILSLSDSVYAYETAIDCYSWQNKRDSGIPTVCENVSSDRYKVLKYIDLYVQAYEKKLESQSTNNIKYSIRTNVVKFYKLLDNARAVLKLGYEKNNQAMIEDAIFYYQEALKVPMESKISKDIVLHELAIIMDPASGIYSKASLKKVVELFYPDINLPQNKRSSCDAESGYDDNGCSKLFRYLSQKFDNKKEDNYSFNFNNIYINKNFSSEFRITYSNNIKKLSFREKELNTLGLYVYIHKDDKDWMTLGDLKAIDRISNEMKKNTMEDLKNFAYAYLNSLDSSIYLYSELLVADFKKSKQMKDKYLKLDISKLNPAKYYFDKLYLTHFANKIEPIYSTLKSNQNYIKKEIDDFIDKRLDRYHVELNFNSSLKQKFIDMQTYKENCYGAKENGIFSECNISSIFDKNRLIQMDEYKKAKENGSIYTLIADGTLKPKIIRTNSKDEIKEFSGIERYWIYSPNMLGNFTLRFDRISSNSRYSDDFNFEWLIEALDKYDIKHNFKPFYGNERPSDIIIVNLPKELK